MSEYRSDTVPDPAKVSAPSDVTVHVAVEHDGNLPVATTLPLWGVNSLADSSCTDASALSEDCACTVDEDAEAAAAESPLLAAEAAGLSVAAALPAASEPVPDGAEDARIRLRAGRLAEGLP